MADTTSIKHPTPLTSGDFTAAEEPFALFGDWFAEAMKGEPSDPNAMSLATVDADGLPAARHIVRAVRRPPGWRGWRIAPVQFEFWNARPFRLHDRIEFRRAAPDQPWSKVRLYPYAIVMAGPVPAIHVFLLCPAKQDVDA